MALLPRNTTPRDVVSDMRTVFFGKRPYRLLFWLASLGTTLAVASLFMGDFKHEKVWKRDIQYVQSWEQERSDATIKAQQKIDHGKRLMAEGERELRRLEERDKYHKLQNQMENLGF